MEQEKKETLHQIQNVPKNKWYKTFWGVVFIIFFWPFVLFWYMWARARWNVWVKVVITLILLVAVIVNSGDNDNQDVSVTENKNEEIAASQEKTKPAESQETELENAQSNTKDNTKKDITNDFEEKNFSLYDEFFKTKNEQLKRMDQVVDNLTISRHQVIIKYIAPVDTTEYDILFDVENKLYSIEEKTTKDNSLHKIMREALSFYYDSAQSCRDWLTLLPTNLSFRDNNRFVSSDNVLVEQMPKYCGMEERKNGDKKVEELLSLLKQKGYKNNTITAGVAQSKQPVQAKQGPAYKEIFSFSGEGAKNSEPFTITGSKFRVVYDCVKKTSSPLCQAVLRSPTDDVLYKEIFNTIGETQSETVFYEKGTFYIEATVMGGEFDIVIEEYK